MKTGKSLVDFAQEITRQLDAKKDFMVADKLIQTHSEGGALELGFDIGNDGFSGQLTENGHDQLGQLCSIPAKYYDLMRNTGSIDLLARNVNHWLQRSDSKRMVRALDGKVRALLSDTYRRLDNFDLANSVLPMLHESEAQIESCEITDTRLYIKAITHKVQGEVKPGDVVSAGILISNSEVGKGSLAVKPLLYRLVCRNGAIADKFALRKYHAGRRQEFDESIQFSNETLDADDKAFWLKVRDLVTHSLSQVTFSQILNEIGDVSDAKIEEPEKAIEMVSTKFKFGAFEKENVLKHLINGGDLTSWGLGNAVTRMAQDVESYDRSTELESIGFQVMTQKW